MVRCFVGMILPENIKERVVKIQDKISNLPIECKFVEKENLHINFSFLGEVDDNKVSVICHILKGLSTGVNNIKCVVDRINLIPNKNFVRVIVLNVVSDDLIKFMEKIKRSVGGDIKPPHITLCRVKKIKDKNIFLKSIEEIKFEPFEFYVDNVSLIKSEIKRSGPVYTKICEYFLNHSSNSSLHDSHDH
jgi:2'-5' RNA ligase